MQAAEAFDGGGDLPAERLGPALEIIRGGAAQPAPGREEGYGLEDVRLAGAIRARIGITT